MRADGAALPLPSLPRLCLARRAPLWQVARQSLQQMRALNAFKPGSPSFELTLDPPMSRPLNKAK